MQSCNPRLTAICSRLPRTRSLIVRLQKTEATSVNPCVPLTQSKETRHPLFSLIELYDNFSDQVCLILLPAKDWGCPPTRPPGSQRGLCTRGNAGFLPLPLLIVQLRLYGVLSFTSDYFFPPLGSFLFLHQTFVSPPIGTFFLLDLLHTYLLPLIHITLHYLLASRSCKCRVCNPTRLLP